MTVYQPGEDSYLLLGSMSIPPGSTVLDMGTGSGILALHAAKKAKKVLAVDISRQAVENLRRLSLPNIQVRRSDLFQNVKERFDVILFNPPYLPREPPLDPQWSGGIGIINRFLSQARSRLRPGGRIFLLVSSQTGMEDVKQTLHSLGYSYRTVAHRNMFFEKLYVLRCASLKS